MEGAGPLRKAEIYTEWRNSFLGCSHEGGWGWDVNYFLRKLALSRRGAVCHTCHGQEIFTCLYRLL